MRPIRRRYTDVFQALMTQNGRKLTFVRRSSPYGVTHHLYKKNCCQKIKFQTNKILKYVCSQQETQILKTGGKPPVFNIHKVIFKSRLWVIKVHPHLLQVS